MRTTIATPLSLVLALTFTGQGALSAAPEPQQQSSPSAQSPEVREARRLQQSGDHAGAAKAWRAVVQAQPGSGAAWYNLGYSLHAAGQLEEASEAHAKAAQFANFGASANYNLACAQALLGKSEDALASLRAAVDAGFVNVALMRGDSDLASLRKDARFQNILDEIGLPLPERLQFWVGRWDCYTPTGVLNGHNVLSSRVSGTVIHEAWTPVGGGAGGESWNYFDRRTQTWRQHWIDPNGGPFVFTGTSQGKGILFEGPRLDGQSTTNRKRMFIRPIAGGRVQQTGTQTSDGGQSWQPEFDLIYVPSGQPFAPLTAGSKADAGGTGAARPAANDARAFDFLIGDWQMEVQQYDAQGNRIRALTEWSRVRPMLGGAALVDEWNGSGFTVRTFDPKQEVWRLFWTDRATSAGRMQFWEGTFENGVGTFVGGASLPSSSRLITSKIEFSEITSDSVLWKMWKTRDQGETWVLDYVRHYRRIAE